MSMKQKKFMQLYAEAIAAVHSAQDNDESNNKKMARCLVAAESIVKGCSKIAIKKLMTSKNCQAIVLMMMRYFVCMDSTWQYEAVLLDLCQELNEDTNGLVEQVLKLNPTKTLEVGYLQVRQLKNEKEVSKAQVKSQLQPWFTCLKLIKSD